MARRASEYKVRAYQLFRSGVPLSEIPERIGCSKSLVYRWASNEKWTSPLQSSLAPIESAAAKIQGGDDLSGLTEVLRTKLPERIAELDDACKKGNVSAIALWFRLTGAPWPQKAVEKTDPVVPTVNFNIQLKNGKPTVIDAEPSVKFIAMPETPTEPGFVNDLSAPGEAANAVTESQPTEKSLA